jgi:hypothetical protein
VKGKSVICTTFNTNQAKPEKRRNFSDRGGASGSAPERFMQRSISEVASETKHAAKATAAVWASAKNHLNSFLIFWFVLHQGKMNRKE